MKILVTKMTTWTARDEDTCHEDDNLDKKRGALVMGTAHSAKLLKMGGNNLNPKFYTLM